VHFEILMSHFFGISGALSDTKPSNEQTETTVLFPYHSTLNQDTMKPVRCLPTFWGYCCLYLWVTLQMEVVYSAGILFARYHHEEVNSADLYKRSPFCLSQYLTNLMHKICFKISFISCLYMFRAHVLIIRRSKLHYTASGVITPIGVMIPRNM